MGTKHARASSLWEAARHEDVAAARQEDIVTREQAAFNIMGMLGRRDLPGGTGSTGGAQVAGGGGIAPPQIGKGFTGGMEDITWENIYGQKIKGRDVTGQTLKQKQIGEGSIFRHRKASEGAIKAGGWQAGGRFEQLAGYELDPEALAKGVAGTAQFRIMNQLMVESEDFLNRQGPLYDRAVRSSIGPIMEGSARSMEQAMAQIKQNFARGGSARRNALKDAIEVQATINNNAQLVSQLSDAHFKLDQIGRQNALQTVQAADAWSKNVAGVRQEYANSMQAMSNYMGQVALPAISSATAQYNSMSSRLGDHKTNWGQIALGAFSSITSPFFAALGA